jgi:hypothetical protein
MTRPLREDPDARTPSAWVRPYVLTRGRTRPRTPLLNTHTLVSAIPGNERVFAAGLQPESRALFELALTGPVSVAELAALCGLQLGVAVVLLADLADAGRLMINSDGGAFDPTTLERVLHGLHRL